MAEPRSCDPRDLGLSCPFLCVGLWNEDAANAHRATVMEGRTF